MKATSKKAGPPATKPESKQPAQLSGVEIKRLRADLRRVPFAGLLGLKFVSLQRGAVVMRMMVRDELKQNNGTLHGGALASLLDTAAAFSVLTLLEPGETTATVNLTISYLHAVEKGQVMASARVLKAGRRLLSVAVEVTDVRGRLLATALSTFMRNQIVQ